ncbi:MAG: NAD(P)/FAD-dependent oxidoreductase [Candidatus Hydrothermarchaeales archaeon]
MTSESEPKGAILQRDKQTYAIVPRIPVGLAKLENFKEIARVVEKYNIPIIKITSGHRLALVGMKGEVVNDVWRDLKMEEGKATELCLHYVQACPGDAVCRFGVQDSLGLGIEIEKFFLNMTLPAKVKIGVSGCPFCCGESFVRDIGVIGKSRGWTVVFGGNSGRRPRIGDIIAENITGEEVIDLCKRSLEFYAANGKKKERTARFIERIGIEEFKKAISNGV